jgi:hypothetical protein
MEKLKDYAMRVFLVLTVLGIPIAIAVFSGGPGQAQNFLSRCRLLRSSPPS